MIGKGIRNNIYDIKHVYVYTQSEWFVINQQTWMAKEYVWNKIQKSK